MATPALEALRPKPFRGDVIAAGVVVLTTLAWLLRVRLDEDWSDGLHLVCAVVALALVAALAVLARMERDTPRAYQSVLYVATVALALLTLLDLAEVLGGDGGAGMLTWVLAAVAVIAFGFAARRNSAVCTLLGGLAAGGAAIAFVDWVASDLSVNGIRWILLGLTIVLALAALAQRDKRRSHAVALIDVAGVAVIAIALTFVVEAFFGIVVDDSEGLGVDVAWGWQLLLLAAGSGLIAYSSVDRERGPAYLGSVSLILFVALASSGDFLGWPLLLLLAAAGLLAIGLRPTTPAPPPPDADAPPAPAEPLRRD